ncbi:PD-(D/E)XK nuclease family protein [Bacillus sp. H-16]|uniref:PD-(D/E)XK nuclease family protein n=1 Tax=Alteribacter salitolerans TaxID=2912333 RepID=UPI001965D96D|nr:PD-(D/E)XK nuclease family protein [Alteribacter salitolerans]MBM7094527.1 PD-(D/E)XK nuclease family protein [Alteribacter salitolerans]
MSPDFLNSLTEIVKKHPLEEKIFIVPSKRDGRLAVEALAKENTPVVNVHSKTIEDLVKETVYWKLLRDGKKELPQEAGRQLVYKIMKELQAANEFEYFSSIKLTPSLSESVYRAILDIKRSLEDVTSLNTSSFQKVEKGEDILKIIERYEQSRIKEGYVDRADLIKEALSDSKTALEKQVFVFFPHDAYHPAAASFINRYTDKASVYAPGYSNLKNTEQNRQMISRDSVPAEVTVEEKMVQHKGDYSLKVAFSAEDEVNQILSHLKNENIPFDQAVIYYPNANTYHSLLYHLKEKNGLQVTFSEGVPVSYYPSGKMLFAFLDWMKSDFTFKNLERMLQERSLFEPEGVSVKKMLRILKNHGVKKGSSSYRRVIERLEETGEYPELKSWLASLFKLVPVNSRYDTVTSAQFLESMITYLKNWVRPSGQDDASCRSHIILMIEQVIPHLTYKGKAGEVIAQSEFWFSQMSATASMPKPGHLHVTPVRTSLYYHFKHVFIPGMTNKNIPGSQKEDPILLDQERTAIHPFMMTSAEHIKREAWKTASIVTCLKGKTHFSYPLMDLANNKKATPAYAFIQLYRVQSGNYEATGEDVEKALTNASSFVNEETSKVSESSWWTNVLFKNGRLEKTFYNNELFAHLLQGNRAESLRQKGELTPYDGHLNKQTALLNPLVNDQVVMSASKLENLAVCPYRYFLKDILGIEAEEDEEEDRYAWLDPAAKGTLLHAIFERFYQYLYDEGKTFQADGTMEWIEPIAKTAIEETRTILPPPNEVIYELESQEILDACYIFLKLEETFSANRKPVHFEYDFGFKERDSVSIPVGEKGTLKLRGKIDRVDKLPDGSFGTVDYKTGGTFGFDEEGFFNGGRKLQHSLYALAFELLNEADRPVVSAAHYLFPTRKGKGEQVLRKFDDQKKAELLQIVDHLTAFIQEGQFPFTEDPNDCKFCDYKPVCMRHRYDEDLVQEKLAHPDTEGAKRLREVRKYD